MIANSDNNEDILAIRQCIDGNEECFAIIVEKYKRQAFFIAYRLVGNTEDAHDLSQDAFLKAYRALNTFRLDASFKGWFFQILKNTCISHLRKRKTRKVDQTVDSDSIYIADTDPNPEDIAANNSMIAMLNEAIDKLSPARKEVIILREFKGYSYEEISRIAGISVEKVKSRLHYARKQLTEELKDYL